MPSSWVHMAIGIAFFGVMFGLDIDHVPNKCSILNQVCQIGDTTKLFLHRWRFPILFGVITFAWALHLLMDSSVNGAYPI